MVCWRLQQKESRGVLTEGQQGKVEFNVEIKCVFFHLVVLGNNDWSSFVISNIITFCSAELTQGLKARVLLRHWGNLLRVHVHVFADAQIKVSHTPSGPL